MTAMQRTLLIMIFLSCFANKVNSQEIEKGYIIYSFEINRHQGSHGNFLYYWITPIDLIKKEAAIKLFPVYLDNFYATNDFNDCCSQKSIDIFTATTATKFEISDFYDKQLDTLILIVSKNKKLVQKITKKWTNGAKEDIHIWATPIIGQFCSCGLVGYSVERIDYKGLIFLPKSDFSLFDDFWNQEISKEILFTDYSKFAYRNSEQH
jgi:hypothetical protein